MAALIGAVIAKRFGAALKDDGATDDEAVKTLALLCGAVAIPVLRTFLTEDDALAALDEIDSLEAMVE